MNCIVQYCGFIVRKFTRKMSSTSYEEAVQKLNSLQSNKSTIDQIRKEIKNGKACTNIEDMENYLLRTGITLPMLDKLSVIHVAGTKGKGSTSAMCESILRHHGYRTGFYSSPHLVAVRERIRLDGRVVEQEHFATHFHRVFDLLNETQEYQGHMPNYFAFLTVLAFNMFIKEKVDVAIVEVGIGGIVDYTNVLRKVPVVGITALGIDHTAVLGNTLPQIAAAKAGIIKPGCVAYTVKQPDEAMNVLYKVADNCECTLHVVPDFKTYKFPKNYIPESPLNLEVYQMNASLAIQLAHAWLNQSRSKITDQIIMSTNQTNGKTYKQNGLNKINKLNNNCDKINGNVPHTIVTIPEATSLGLSKFRWPGRYQIIQTEYARFFLDGAHTKESIEKCAKWFIENNRLRDKILIFSSTGNRDAQMLLNPLIGIDFHAVFFVVPSANKGTNMKNDNYSLNELNEALSTCRKNAELWTKMTIYNEDVNVEECVLNTLTRIKQNFSPKTAVLITGSLHLVGAALSILDPLLKEE